MPIDDAVDLIGDLVGLVQLRDRLLRSFDDALVGDRDERLDRAMLEAALDHAKELLLAEPLFVIDEQRTKKIALAFGLLDRRGHTRVLPPVGIDKLEVVVDVDFAGDALGFDDDQAVLVDDEVIDLGDLAFAF